MTSRSRNSASYIAAAFVALPACVGMVEGIATVDDPQPEPVPEADPQALAVTGTVSSYFSTMLGLFEPVEAELGTEGFSTVLTTQSGTDGRFMLPDIPVGSVFHVTVAPSPRDFRPTRNAVAVVDRSIDISLYAIANSDIVRQYASSNISERPNTGVALVDLIKCDGSPLTGIAPTAISLLAATQTPVALDPAVNGPLFMGRVGDACRACTTAEVHLGKSRAILLNVAPGEYTLQVEFTDATGTVRQQRSLLVIASGGVTQTRSCPDPRAGAVPPPDLTFTRDIHPILQTGSRGGDGCANCHHAGGLAAVLPFDEPAAQVYQAITTRPGIIDRAAPGQSLLLSKPLYEVPPNHVNATYATPAAWSYRMILAWIEQGARL
jgi:hypothetical protein